MTAILAEPFTQQEAADFEQLIFASNNPDHAIRLAARCALASFVNHNGKIKCDLILAHLSSFHDDPDKRLDS